MALTIGLDLDYYWNKINPNQLKKHVKVFEDMTKFRAKEADVNNWNLGRYLIFAFNEPNKYPKKPYLSNSEAPRAMTGEEMERIARRNNRRLKGTVNYGD